MSIPRFSVRNPLAINLLTIFAILAGILSIFTIRKEAFPPISFDMVTIRTVYPGATPEVVEKFVTIKIEDELKGVDGIDEMTSVSAQNISLIALQLDPDNKDRRKVITEIQRAVDRVDDLPELPDQPFVTEIEAAKFPVITVSLRGDNPAELQKYAKILEDRLLNLSDVGSVNRLGYHDPEIWVEIDPEKASLYHLSIKQTIEALRDRNVNLTGGSLFTQQGEVNVRTDGEFYTAAEIEDVIVRANDQGRAVRIKDIAEVKDAFEDDDILYSTDSKKSINLAVVKKESGDILKMVDDITEISDEFKLEIPESIELAYVDDFSYFVRRRLGVLVNNGMSGALLILIFLFLVLAPPIAFTAAIDIPVTFLITIAIMKLMGMTINLMSMFGMIMVVGMLVDDAIIMAENVFRHIEKGGDPRLAAIHGGEEVMRPVTASVLTSVCAYLPLAFMSGIIGQYVRAIPIVVTIALSVSWLTTIFSIPTHAAEFTMLARYKFKKGRKHWFDHIRNAYMAVIRRAIRFRYLTFSIILGFVMFTVAVILPQMKFVLFTSDGMDEFYVRAETEIGTPIEQTQAAIRSAEAVIARLPDHELEHYVTEAGVTRENAGDPLTQYGSHLVQTHVYLTPSVDRKRTAFEIMDEVSQGLAEIKGLKDLRVDKVRPGPPVGKAIEAKIRGDDFESILKVVEKFKTFLAGIEGVENVDDDFNQGRDEIDVVLNRDQVARTGLSYRSVSGEIRNAFEGGIATTIQNSDEEVDVRVKWKESERQSIEALNRILIPNNLGNLIPLSEIATLTRKSSIASIKRFDRKRMVMVYADVNEDIITSVEANRRLMSYFDEIRPEHTGIDVVYAGEQERTQESMTSLMIAFGAAMLMIFCIISIQFKSIAQPPIVMLTIPLGLIGVIWALYLHGKPFGFLSIMGFIGLSGVVVNDSIVMIDFMNNLRRKGVERRESILMACESRFRAILMASLTTVVGTMPMAYGLAGDDPFIRPMALAFTWGMAFASLITLFAIPCFYAIVDDISVKILRRPSVRLPEFNMDSPQLEETA